MALQSICGYTINGKLKARVKLKELGEQSPSSYLCIYLVSLGLTVF